MWWCPDTHWHAHTRKQNTHTHTQTDLGSMWALFHGAAPLMGTIVWFSGLDGGWMKQAMTSSRMWLAAGIVVVVVVRVDLGLGTETRSKNGVSLCLA